MTKITLIGCGHMGTALVKGWMSLPGASYEIQVIKPSPEFRDNQIARLAYWTPHYHEVWDDSVIILAVKPGLMREAVTMLKPNVKGGQSVLTIAAGIAVQQYKDLLPYNPVTRVMPALPAAQHQSLSAVYGDEPQVAQQLFDPLGGTVVVNDDRGIDVATLLLGSGPGYMAYFYNAFKNAAVDLGMDKDAATQFIKAMGTASTNWLQGQTDFGAAVRSVGAKGSMTGAATDMMTRQRLPETIKAALNAALAQAEKYREQF